MQISWDKEARFRLPVAAWRDMMDHYYPNSAWLRLRRDTFERLADYKRRHAASPRWDQTIEQLVPAPNRDGGAMNRSPASKPIANAVLYEGYALYPYRPAR